MKGHRYFQLSNMMISDFPYQTRRERCHLAAVETHIAIEREALSSFNNRGFRCVQAENPAEFSCSSSRWDACDPDKVVRTRFGGHQLLRYMANSGRKESAT